MNYVYYSPESEYTHNTYIKHTKVPVPLTVLRRQYLFTSIAQMSVMCKWDY